MIKKSDYRNDLGFERRYKRKVAAVAIAYLTMNQSKVIHIPINNLTKITLTRISNKLEYKLRSVASAITDLTMFQAR